jgi:hypothetical protein
MNGCFWTGPSWNAESFTRSGQRRTRSSLSSACSPPGQPPLTVELTLHPSDRDYTDIAQPQAGEVRGFLYDPKSGKLEFNLEDDRNNLTVMLGDADAMAAELERELDGGY